VGHRHSHDLGYGDTYPTTSLGYVIAVVTIVVGSVILALPVGVIGGSFSQNWKNYDNAEGDKSNSKAQETFAITQSIQRIDPSSVSSLMLIDVWNDRFAEDSKQAWGSPRDGFESLPLCAEFLGHVLVELELTGFEDLPPDQTTVTRTLSKLPLRDDRDICDRPVTGSITIKYDWTPRKPETDMEEMADTPEMKAIRPLSGTLQVTLVSADKLINLDLHSLHSASNPFCTVLCYPSSPEAIGEILVPSIWRTPTVRNSLHPQWHNTYSFEFSWTRPRAKPEVVASAESETLAMVQPDGHPKARTFDDKFDEFLSLIQDIGAEIKQVREKAHTLSDRVDQLSSEPR